MDHSNFSVFLNFLSHVRGCFTDIQFTLLNYQAYIYVGFSAGIGSIFKMFFHTGRMAVQQGANLAAEGVMFKNILGETIALSREFCELIVIWLMLSTMFTLFSFQYVAWAFPLSDLHTVAREVR